jgi:hypothetical protein
VPPGHPSDNHTFRASAPNSAPQLEMARCGKMPTNQAFLSRHPHSAPMRELAACGEFPAEYGRFWRASRVMARCGGILGYGPVSRPGHVPDRRSPPFSGNRRSAGWSGQETRPQRGVAVAQTFLSVRHRRKRLCHRPFGPPVTSQTFVPISLAGLSSLPVRTSRLSRSFSIDDHRAQPPSTGRPRCQKLFAPPHPNPLARRGEGATGSPLSPVLRGEGWGEGSSARTFSAAADLWTGGPRSY